MIISQQQGYPLSTFSVSSLQHAWSIQCALYYKLHTFPCCRRRLTSLEQHTLTACKTWLVLNSRNERLSMTSNCNELSHESLLTCALQEWLSVQGESTPYLVRVAAQFVCQLVDRHQSIASSLCATVHPELSSKSSRILLSVQVNMCTIDFVPVTSSINAVWWRHRTAGCHQPRYVTRRCDGKPRGAASAWSVCVGDASQWVQVFPVNTSLTLVAGPTICDLQKEK